MFGEADKNIPAAELQEELSRLRSAAIGPCTGCRDRGLTQPGLRGGRSMAAKRASWMAASNSSREVKRR